MISIYQGQNAAELVESESSDIVVLDIGLPDMSGFDVLKDIQSFYAKELKSGRTDGKGGLSATTIIYHHKIIKKALKQAVNLDLVARNVAEGVSPPRTERPRLNVLGVDEIPKLLDALQETPFYVYYCLLLYTGLRRGEALALRWKNIDFENGKLQVLESVHRLHNGEYQIKEPKTPHSRRSVSISESLKLLLLEYKCEQEKAFGDIGKSLSPDNFLFSRLDNGLPFDPDSLTKAFRLAIKKADLPYIRLHDLRHTHATLMLKAGIHPKIVSERLGHANIGITLDTYSHVLPGMQDEAAEKFDSLICDQSENIEEKPSVGKMWASEEEAEREPHRNRTCNLLIKSQLLCQLS